MNLKNSPTVIEKIYLDVQTLKTEEFDTEWTEGHKSFDSRTRPLQKNHLEIWKAAGVEINLSKEQTILEIGGGFGRTLLEVYNINPKIDFISIVICPWIVGDIVVLEKIAKTFFILTQEEQEKAVVNKFYHYAISDTIPFIPDSSIDRIISIYTYNVFPRTDLLIQDLWRILKPDGVMALPHLNKPLLLGDETVNYVEYLESLGLAVCRKKDRLINVFLRKDREKLEIPVIPLFDEIGKLTHYKIKSWGIHKPKWQLFVFDKF